MVAPDSRPTEIVWLPLTEIVLDAGTEARGAIDGSAVHEYTARMRAGATVAPLTVFHDAGRYYLADGFHRVYAAQNLHWRVMEVEVHEGTREDALWYAMGVLNVAPMRMRNRDVDRQHAVPLALTTWPEKSVGEIARHIGMPEHAVARIKQELDMQLALTLPADDDEVRRSQPKQKPKRVYRPQDWTTHPKLEAVIAAVREGRTSREITHSLHVRGELVAHARRVLGIAGLPVTGSAIAARRDQILALAEQGYSSRQIADSIGITGEHVRKILRRKGLTAVGDVATYGTKRHDSNRIMERLVLDAENLLEGSDLIRLSALDAARLPDWLDSLKRTRNQLGVFIRQLMKERQDASSEE